MSTACCTYHTPAASISASVIALGVHIIFYGGIFPCFISYKPPWNWDSYMR